MAFPQPQFLILFVNDPINSGFFYRKLLKKDPIEESATFVLFALTEGLMLGLWSRWTAKPPVTGQPGGSEICFSEDSDLQVDALYHQWLELGIEISLAPTAMEGMSRTFVALDPDGHRLRVLRVKEDHRE